MFSSDRNELRKHFFDAWHKQQNKQPLEPFERQIVAVIQEHPEYHTVFNSPESYQNKDYLPELGETNPFLHLSLHLSIREQLTTNRPAGIREVFKVLQAKGVTTHDIEHQMIECLAEAMWSAQRAGTLPDESAYLIALKNLQKR